MNASHNIRRLALELLKSRGEEYVALQDIRSYVSKRVDPEGAYTPGMYSGAMRDLVAESAGRVINPHRGLYGYVSDVKVNQINGILEDAATRLLDLATVNLLDTSDHDIQTIHRLPPIAEAVRTLKIGQHPPVPASSPSPGTISLHCPDDQQDGFLSALFQLDYEIVDESWDDKTNTIHYIVKNTVSP